MADWQNPKGEYMNDYYLDPPDKFKPDPDPAFEIPDDPRDIIGDYLRDEMIDREHSPDDYDYESDDLEF